MADVRLQIRADSATAQREIQTLRRKEIAQLQQTLGQTQRSADVAGNEIDQMGRQARQASGAVDTLGDQSRQSAAQMRGMGNAAQRAGRDQQSAVSSQ